MAHIIASRVGESSASSGAADIVLTQNLTGHQRFSAVMVVGDTAEVVAEALDGSAWQRMVATYSALNTLSRTTLIESSTGLNVTFAAGGLKVFLVGPDTAREIEAVAAKATPVDADKIPLRDSVGGLLKSLTWANLKATLKTYLDTLYLATVTPGTSGNVLTSNGSAWISSAPTVPSVGDHCVTVYTGNGYGSTNTKIRRFTTTLESTGTAITYADSAADGASFTINETGLYSIIYSDTGAAGFAGVSANSNELTTNVQLINVAHRLALGYGTTPFVGAVVRLVAADVVRAHTAGIAGTTDNVKFSIRKVGT